MPVSGLFSLESPAGRKQHLSQTLHHQYTLCWSCLCSHYVIKARCVWAQGIKKPELRDELYMQLLKQSRGNCTASSALAWELFYLVASAMPPSKDFVGLISEYVHTVRRGAAHRTAMHAHPRMPGAQAHAKHSVNLLFALLAHPGKRRINVHGATQCTCVPG